MNKLNLLNPQNIIRLFFLLIIFNYIYFSIRFSLRENPWIAGDWLINYGGGILRRGLSGEIILFLSKILFVNIIHLLIFFQISFFVLFLFFLFKILKHKNINLWFLFLIFSPVTISFTFYDPLAVGRKEVIFFFYYTIYLFYFIKNLEKSNFIYFTYFLTGFIFVLIHEIFIFFSFFFIFSKYFYLQKYTHEINLSNFLNEIFLFLGSLLALITLIFFSSKDPNLKNLVCNKLLLSGLTNEICNGAMNEIVFSKYISSYKSFGIIKYIYAYSYLKTYTISCLLFFIPLFLFLKNSSLNRKEIYLFIYGSTLQFLFLVSIFVVVNDWGRYLNLYFIFNLIFISYFFLNKDIKLIELKFKNLFLVIIFIIYSTTWHMPHCCQKSIGKGLVSFKDRINYRLNNPTNYDDKTRDLIIKLFR